MIEFTGASTLLGLIILVLDIIVIFQVLTGGGSAGYKLLWTLAILFLPVIGLILYFIFGGMSRTATS